MGAARATDPGDALVIIAFMFTAMGLLCFWRSYQGKVYERRDREGRVRRPLVDAFTIRSTMVRMQRAYVRAGWICTSIGVVLAMLILMGVLSP